MTMTSMYFAALMHDMIFLEALNNSSMNYQSPKNKKCDFCFSRIFNPAMAGLKIMALPCATETLTHQSFLQTKLFNVRVKQRT
ncbi:MAG: hypothetical protein A3G96_02375 [Gammaproteobacteria bacterium RIFCSPLOWO2_12_FULL_52_10]|nr:MAG: hypothetical protein A3G96_02375 [Gammaproteobacteria bacterium RIFCSPLOWO2_12_FULL_52_10]